MSVLLDKKYHRDLKSAWKTRTAEHGITRQGNTQTRWFRKAIFIFLTCILIAPALASIALSGNTTGENVARLIIICSGIGGLVYSILGIALLNGRSMEILGNTPVSDKLALRHLLRGLIPTGVCVVIIIAVISLVAHDELGVESFPRIATIAALIAGATLAFCMACITSLRISVLWITLASGGMIAFLLVASWVPGMGAILDSASPWMTHVLPSGWPVEYIHYEQTPEYLGLKICLALALLSLAAYYLNVHLRMWQFPRPSYDEDQSDMEDYLEETGQSPGTQSPAELRNWASQYLVNIETHHSSASPSSGWLERCIYLVSGESEKKLVLCLGLSRLTRSLYRAIIIITASFLVHRFFPPHVMGAGIVRIFAILVMAAGSFTILPVSTMAGSFLRRIKLNMQTVSPVCALFPVSITNALRLHLAECWVRAVVCLPLVTVALWFFHDSRGSNQHDVEYVFFLGYQSTCFLLAIPAATFAWTVFFGSNSGNWRTGRKLHAFVMLLFLLPHVLLPVCTTFLMPQTTSALWKLVFAAAITATSALLILLSIHHYRSPRTETVYPCEDQ